MKKQLLGIPYGCTKTNLLNINVRHFNFVSVALTVILLVFFSCKKNNLEEEDVSPRTGTRTELTLDSLFLYAKEIYLWNESLPNYSSFAPRDRYNHITSEMVALDREIFDISQFKINQNTNLPYEFTKYGIPKYSFMTTAGKGMGKTAFQRTNSGSDLIWTHIDSVSYFAINFFPELSAIESDLDDIFAEITSHNPSTIVIDLRNNGGGHIESAEYLANLIAPSRLNGKVMFTLSYNQTLQSGKAKILKNQPYKDINGKYVIKNGRKITLADVDYTEKGNTHVFRKKGKLESIKNIYFITSGKTASASELLISIFKPYFNIKLVGEKTFGKPVGFFDITIDSYSVSLCNFLIKNATGWFDYFDNMNPDIKLSLPSNPKLGDPEELGFKSIITDLNPTNKISTNRATINKIYNQKVKDVGLSNRGLLIENRLKLKD